MAPIFSPTQRQTIQRKLLEIGVNLIREKGIRSMTIDEVTCSAEIGKGTFYHFFKSKELYILEVIRFSKENMLEAIDEIIGKQGGIDRKALMNIFKKFSFTGPSNIISSITSEDEAWLREKLPPELMLNPPREEKIASLLIEHLINAKKDIDIHVIANMIKIMALTAENREILYEDALEKNLTMLQESLCDYIFNK